MLKPNFEKADGLGIRGILQHFKFENWRIQFLMSRTGHMNLITYLSKWVFFGTFKCKKNLLMPIV